MDVIDQMLRTAPGGALDTLRAGRAAARAHAQGSYEALLDPADPKDFPVADRMLVAAFLAVLAGVPEAVEFYCAKAVDHDSAGRAEAVIAEARRASVAGPYGGYRGAPAAESVAGPEHVIGDPTVVMLLSEQLIAALEFTHFLVLHPRDASRARLQALLDAGWTVDGIVTLSQLVSFLSFQVRVVAGLAALDADAEAAA